MPDSFIMQSIVNALGWMLIHFLWQGCVIAAVLWLSLKAAARASAQSRYLLGLLASLAVAVVPATTLLLALNRPVASAVSGATELPAISVLAGGLGAGGGPWLQLALEPALPLVVGLWALGVVVLSFRTLLGWWAAHRLVRRGVSAAGAELERTLAGLKQRIGVQRAVTLLRSVRVSVPTVVGWMKPIILLPAGVITALPREQLEMVIAHELAHVRRYDYLVNLLQLFIETLFFYHPAVRWISRQVRQEREHCCDDLVVTTCGQPVVYARALTRLESLRDLTVAPALAATGGDLFARVSRIVQRESPRVNSGLAQITLVTVLALATSLGAQHGLDAAIKQVKPQAEPQWLAKGAISGLASIGNGWRRHLSAWSPPLRPVTKPVAAAPQTPALATLSPATPETFQSTNSGGRQEAPEFRPNPPPETPVLARLTPRPTISRQELLAGSAAQDSGQASVTPLFTVSPEYPEFALEEGVEGSVKLRFKVTAQGQATDIQVVRAQPEAVFDHAAVAALQQWKFQVNPGHDPAAVLAQTFDFAWQEVIETLPRLRGKECIRTGTRVCAHPYTDEHAAQIRPESNDAPEAN